MKRWLFAVVVLVGCPVFAQQGVPEIPFDSVKNFITFPPNSDFNLGEASGVAVNSKGHVFVFSRGNSSGTAFASQAAQLLEFDKDGKFVREIGHNLYAWSFAHAVRTDKDDNIWAIDKGSDMIVKFTPDGRVDMVFGRKPEASDEGAKPYDRSQPPTSFEDGRFRQPTDVAWDAAGNTYVADGYVNSRVGKIDKNGRWVKSWGKRGSAPGEFNTVHGIAVDSKGLVYVADRSNRRVQVFDGDGNFQRAITIDVPYDPNTVPVIGNIPNLKAPGGGGLNAPGAPWTVCIPPGNSQVMYVPDSWPGRIYKLSLDGKVLGVLGRSGKQLKEFGWIHSMACPSENELYTAEIINWRVQKLILHPAPSSSSR
jgi:sugar lactone lactonase YvrE